MRHATIFVSRGAFLVPASWFGPVSRSITCAYFACHLYNWKMHVNASSLHYHNSAILFPFNSCECDAADRAWYMEIKTGLLQRRIINIIILIFTWCFSEKSHIHVIDMYVNWTKSSNTVPAIWLPIASCGQWRMEVELPSALALIKVNQCHTITVHHSCAAELLIPMSTSTLTAPCVNLRARRWQTNNQAHNKIKRLIEIASHCQNSQTHFF